MKQRIIIRVHMNNQKSRACALKTVVGVTGVESVALIGSEKDQLQVIGEGIDSVVLTRMLRKKVAYAVLVSVGEAKKEEASVKKPEVPMPSVVGYPPVVGYPLPSYGFPHYGSFEVRESVYDPSCIIM